MRCFQHFDREALGSCVNCGKGVCLDCLNKEQGRIYCGDCQPAGSGGLSIRVSSGHSLSFGNMVASRPSSAMVVSNKNRYFAALLAFCAGTFGVHKFYLGQPGWGFLYLLFFWSGLPSLVGFIEGVLYLARSEEDFTRRFGQTLLTNQSQQVLLSSTVSGLPSTPKQYERFLLQFAQRHGGQISMAHLMAEVELRQDKVEDALARLSAKGVVTSEMDDSGFVRYYVPEFRRGD
ncbi:MAG: NINE protein [Candidatus Sericytochromatia bacterium]